MKELSRKETGKDRGLFKGVAFKNSSPSKYVEKLTGRKRGTITTLRNEIVSLIKKNDNPVDKEGVKMVIDELGPAIINVLKKYGELNLRGVGTFYNRKVKQQNNAPVSIQSSDDNFKKLGYIRAYLVTGFTPSDTISSAMNGRKSIIEKVKYNKNKFKELRIVREQAYKEEDAALGLMQIFDGEQIDQFIEDHEELVYWGDISCFHTAGGKKVSDLPVRKEEVRRRFMQMIDEKKNGNRYMTVWDEYMSIPALKKRGIEPDISKWPLHEWSFEEYLGWCPRRGGRGNITDA